MIGLEVQAKKFFKVVETGDVSFLGLDNADEEFSNCYDLYFKEKDDAASKISMNKRVKIAVLENEIETVRVSCDYILNMPLTDNQRNALLNALSKQGYKIDRKKDIKEEVKKIQRVKLGAKKNALNKEIAELKRLTKTDSKPLSFDAALANMESVLDKDHIPENITLGRFVAYEKLIKEKIQSNGR